MSLPTLAVCIVTYERPQFLRRCLVGLGTERSDIAEVVVVDASARPDRLAAPEPGELPVEYVWAPHLAGWMTRSRNEALLHLRAGADVVAFLDDDVVVHPGWARALRAGYVDESVAAVTGRTRNNQPGEESYSEPIGRLRRDGTLSEGFASQSGGVVEVDHGIGANMSFRRTVLARLGGFRDDYPGTALREDTDMFLRVRSVGGRVLFVPEAVVDHLPAPHVVGARFDTRYKLYSRRNHLVLLARHAGAGSPMVRRWVVRQLADIGRAGGVRRVLERAVVTVVGLCWGVAAVVGGAARWRALPAERAGGPAERIRGVLTGAALAGE